MFPDPEPKADAAPGLTPDIILCIPGPWADRAAFMASMMERHSGAFMALGNKLINRGADYQMELEFCPRNADLEASFRAGGRGRMDEQELAAVAGHQSVVYLTAAAGSLEQVFAATESAASVLDAGGLAVSAETGRAAFGPELWRELSSDNIAFVAGYLVLVRETPDSVRSFGLRAFGLPDVYCVSDEPETGLEELANTFMKYQLFENPAFENGQTFSVAPDAPVYRVSKISDENTPIDVPAHNPYGLIRLEPA